MAMSLYRAMSSGLTSFHLRDISLLRSWKEIIPCGFFLPLRTDRLDVASAMAVEVSIELEGLKLVAQVQILLLSDADKDEEAAAEDATLLSSSSRAADEDEGDALPLLLLVLSARDALDDDDTYRADLLPAVLQLAELDMIFPLQVWHIDVLLPLPTIAEGFWS